MNTDDLEQFFNIWHNDSINFKSSVSKPKTRFFKGRMLGFAVFSLYSSKHIKIGLPVPVFAFLAFITDP